MNHRLITLGAALAAILGLSTLVPASAGELHVARPMAYMSTPCTADNNLNCYYNAGARGDRHGHSYYSIVIGRSRCVKFWDFRWDAFHGYCKPIPGAW